MNQIKNLKEVSDRIKKAVKNKEKIIIYGDADLDGVSSVITLEESIKNIGGEVLLVYFPDREKEEYGVNLEALDFLKKHAPAIIIAVDCGISNFKEAEVAKKMGFELIIIDHHEVLDKLPEASIVVDPKQKGDNSFKKYAAAGIVYELSKLILSKNLKGELKEKITQLVGLATIADMMPKEGENKKIIEDGLKSIIKNPIPGLKLFLELEKFQGPMDFNEKIYRILSVLNVRDIDDGFPASYRLFNEKSQEKSNEIIQGLLIKEVGKKERIQEILKEVENQIVEKEIIIFAGFDNWNAVLLGPVASLICHKYQKPTFLYRKNNTESRGTVRMPKGLDAVDAMKTCSNFLKTFGGHPPAAGFALENKNLDNFKNCLINYFNKKI